MSVFAIGAVVVVGYLLGSIPAGLFAGRIAGVDIQKVGSGNIGATNVLRTLGPKYGYAVFAFDVLKGFGAVFLGSLLAQRITHQPTSELLRIVAAVAAVIGHSFPVWLRFRGGKGVATSAGALLALAPIACGIAFAVWLLVFATTRFVSVGSIAAALVLPFAVAMILRAQHSPDRALIYFTASLSIVVLIRHRSNFARLMNGTEQRFTRK